MFKRVQKCVRLSTIVEIVLHMLYLAIAEIGKTAPVAQLDGRPTGNQELVVGLTPPGRQHSFVETDHEIFSLQSFSSFRCQLLAKECAKYWLTA